MIVFIQISETILEKKDKQLWLETNVYSYTSDLTFIQMHKTFVSLLKASTDYITGPSVCISVSQTHGAEQVRSNTCNNPFLSLSQRSTHNKLSFFAEQTANFRISDRIGIANIFSPVSLIKSLKWLLNLQPYLICM